MESIFKAALGLFFSWLLLACEQRPVAPALRYSATPHQVSNTTIYRLAVHPLYNPKKLSAAYQPLIDYLNQNLPGTTFELEASRDYQAFEQKFRAREPAFLLPNPWQTLQALTSGKTFKTSMLARKSLQF
jgi:phosphonate transport system substrate-binding protein